MTPFTAQWSHNMLPGMMQWYICHKYEVTCFKCHTLLTSDAPAPLSPTDPQCSHTPSSSCSWWRNFKRLDFCRPMMAKRFYFLLKVLQVMPTHTVTFLNSSKWFMQFQIFYELPSTPFIHCTLLFKRNSFYSARVH